MFCLLPFNISDEAVTFRVWEGALSALLAGTSLLLTLRAKRTAVVADRAPVLLCFTAALLFSINPPLGVACYLNLLLLLLRAKLGPARFVRRGLVAAGALALVLTPWMIRNAVVLDKIIPLRSNFGLELAIANHDAASSGEADHPVFLHRLRTIHPLESQAAFNRMQASGGEVAYAAQIGAEAKAWIARHPADFLRLCGRHLRQFYFPPAWQWSIYGRAARGVQARQAVLWTVAFVGLIGAVLALFVWRRQLTYFAVLALVPALPYVIVQPVPRYRYIVLLPLLFLAAEVVGRLTARLSRRQSSGSRAEAVHVT